MNPSTRMLSKNEQDIVLTKTSQHGTTNGNDLVVIQ